MISFECDYNNGASRQEENLCVRHAAGLSDAGLGAFAELVETIGCWLSVVILNQVVEHLFTGTVVVVTFE